MQLKDIRPGVKNKKPKRVGRGPGSGHGKTSCRGHKGAKARSGRLHYIGHEGDNVPFFRKIPKRGFYHKKRISYQIVNIQDLSANFSDNESADTESLLKKRLIDNKYKPIKILGKGKLDKALNVTAHSFSEKAKQTIEKQGGTVKCLAL